MKVATAAAIIVLIGVSFVGYQFYLGSISSTSHQSSPATSTQSVTSGQTPPPPELVNPNFNGSQANIGEPSDYSALVQFALNLINQDRSQSGVSNVTLSSIESGQQHADSLDYYGTIGHWDVQGYKPYMRYTLLGGTGAVAENVAQDYCTNSSPSDSSIVPTNCSLQTVENGIANADSGMMNRDSTCCNNGHRDTILDPMHNRVSIGVAYNETTDAVYFVEDFEDSYINFSSIQQSGGTVTLAGTTQQDLTGWTGSSSGADIVVYYDPTPTTIPAVELAASASCSQYNELSEPSSCQYQGAYTPGQKVSTVLAPCPIGSICGSGDYIYAQTWQVGSGSFQIEFSLSSLISQYGNGVYTLYLWPNGDSTEPITSLSFFITGGLSQ